MYDTEERSMDHTPMLPAFCLVAPVGWELDADIEQALRTEPTPPPVSSWASIQIEALAVDEWFMCSEETWDATHVHLQRDMRRQRPVVVVPIQESEVRRFLRPFWTSRCPGLVTCNCKPGFVGNGITCYDLKLCAGGSCCHQEHPGSFNCLVPPEDDLHSSPGDSRSVQFQCGGRRCPVGEDCISVGGTSLCADPCLHYTVLNDAWRSTTNNGNVNGEHCDQSINWQGWYRLFLGDTSVQMPERCVERYMCGTAAPMWLTEPHPQLLDGVVQRGVCGHWFSECCRFRENPIHVKACYGNYYVYKFVPPTQCNLAYCADVNTKVCSTCGVFDACVSDDKINWRCERKALELVCGPNFIQVGLQMVNLEAGRLDPSSGHLADPSCSAHQEANGTVWYQVERREGRCGNTLETNSTHAVYSNSLFVYPLNARNESLSQPLSIPFSCAYPLETESSLDVAIKPYLLTEGGVSGLGAKAESFMSLYRNANFTEAYPPGEVLLPVGSALHVGVSVDETYDQLVVVLENCYATHTPTLMILCDTSLFRTGALATIIR
ncbi:uromodulin-like [Oncorhynchus keta]|uniref:uromodulin-like n=1 Tax=Oncorhynchus keta TaxID=8018 RepID=UPI00227BEB7C|nr:uromodulin-like [Oncorhynchus keta]